MGNENINRNLANFLCVIQTGATRWRYLGCFFEFSQRKTRFGGGSFVKSLKSWGAGAYRSNCLLVGGGGRKWGGKRGVREDTNEKSRSCSSIS